MSRHPDPSTHCTPLADWPELDRAAWTAARAPSDPFEPSSGYAGRWKASTCGGIENGYGRWLGWLARTGQLDPNLPPGQRVTHERVVAYRDMLRAAGNADNTIAGRLQQLCNALRAMAPSGDWAWIHLASSRIASNAQLVRDPAERMQPVEDVVALGQDLMDAAEHDRFRTRCDRATLFRDGLLIGFLIQRPFRSANLACISLGRHLEQRGGRWLLTVGATETKNREEIEGPWPANLVDALERYLQVHREALLDGSKPRLSTAALWISRQGNAMGADSIYAQICGRTKEEFGKSINPHTFRHIVATAIATSNPKGVADIKYVLGHTSMAASEKYYNRAKMLGAGASLHESIKQLRKEGRRV